jgi:hypothetical protein
MRSILSFALFVFFSCTTTNNIGWDRTKADNVRHIGSKGRETKIDNATYNFTLTVFSGPKQTYYCLLISSIWRINDNDIVLMKLSNDETIKLVADNVNVGQVDWPTYSPIIGYKTPSGVLSTKKADYFSSIYPLDNDLMYKIESQGVKKIRIQFGTSYKEQSWSRDWLGKYIKESHELLAKQLETPAIQTKSIEQGF